MTVERPGFDVGLKVEEPQFRHERPLRFFEHFEDDGRGTPGPIDEEHLLFEPDPSNPRLDHASAQHAFESLEVSQQSPRERTGPFGPRSTPDMSLPMGSEYGGDDGRPILFPTERGRYSTKTAISSMDFLVISGTVAASSGYPHTRIRKARSLAGLSSTSFRNFMGDGV